MARASFVTIDLNAIRSNAEVAKSMAPNSQLLAVVKANAYGHGAIKVAKALSHYVDGFAVACIEEAQELRSAGITTPILLLEGFFDEAEIDAIAQLNLWCVLHSIKQIEQLLAHPLKAQFNIWLKLDTGMHRLGIETDDLTDIVQALRDAANINEIVLMTHLACADDFNESRNKSQIAIFDSQSEHLKLPQSIANSAALISHSDSHRDWVRPGVMLYGVNPVENHPLQLIPTMYLSAKIISQKIIKVGEYVGYGNSWQAQQDTKIGTVAIGYADGYPRHAKTGTPVAIEGKRTHIIGRVSMDMLAIDLSAFEGDCEGLEVELWGGNVSVQEVATYCGMIPYELLCGVSSRLYTRYIGEID